MGDEKLIRRLDQISRRFGKSDKDIEYGNLATKVHGLLTRKSGRLDPGETEGLRRIGEEVVALAGAKTKPLRSKGASGGPARGGRGAEI